MAVPRSPYKFLDPYELEDAEIFFGREHESKILLADIVTTRLVVLFAKTGTGKTSLINAGVRPFLGKRGYETFFIRVRGDPVGSARATIEHDTKLRLPAGASFADQLEWLGRELARLRPPRDRVAGGRPDDADDARAPIVLFFDQFEEFFLYVARESPAQARAFVADVARVYDNEESGVHVVFSLREEFLAEMEIFRDEIPTIFAADSNLRLRWFTPDQARTAFVEPARVVGLDVEPALAERMVDDLSAIGLSIPGTNRETPIEPAQLQIVSDTIWRERSNGALTLEGYLALGDRGGNESVAQQILDQRLAEEFEKLQSEEELELLSRLLPELHTERGTKWVRELAELAQTLGEDEETLRALLAQLGRSGLVDVVTYEGADFVELVHDYLAEPRRVEAMRRAVRAVWPTRLVSEAAAAGRLLTSDDLRAVERAAPHLSLSPAEGELLLRSVVAEVRDLDPLLPALERSGAPIWELLYAAVGTDQAEAVVESIDRVRRPNVVRVLEAALARPEVAERAAQLLGAVSTTEAVDLLAAQLGDDEVGRAAQESLGRLARTHAEPVVAEQARVTLHDFLTTRLDQTETARSAVQSLAAVESVEAVQELERALGSEYLLETAFQSLLALSASTLPNVADRARAAVRGSLERGDRPAELVDRLAASETPFAVELLGRLLADDELHTAAQTALRALLQSSRSGVADAAARALGESPPATARVEPRRRPQPSGRVDPDHLRFLAHSLLRGRVVPVLGLGVNLADRPADAGFEPGRYPPSGPELAEHLARVFHLPYPESTDLVRGAQHAAVAMGSGPLYDELRSIFDADYPPTVVHRFLAALPALVRSRGGQGVPLIVTTNYDDILERALDAEAEPYDVVSYLAAGESRGRFRHRQPDGSTVLIERPNKYHGLQPDERPVVLKLFGTLDRADAEYDSFVISEDDFIDFLAERDFANLIPPELAKMLLASNLLFLGFGIRAWNMRVPLARIWGRQRVRFEANAVLLNPDEFESGLWHRRGIDVVNERLDTYVEALWTVLNEQLEAP